ncbi:cell division protein DivIVA [Streptomyces sp. Ru73]|uniref:DivIVA domain-containing protein n=1 Tax=Streptomyces sp. Ru73 TaxID=2080748 RepID=UPI000CDE10BC|nr:DivIVA domain-containing protein [Streptomyces sp. Ru73]POX40528.1 cell division protein DivIVA [Streptomyces sp. Ru73]
MFWFLLIALVAVVAVVTLAVIGGGDGGTLREAEPERLHDPLPADRPCTRADVEEVRLPSALRGYRMNDVDDVLDRLGAELAERDARIAELEAALAGANAAAMGGGPGLVADERPGPVAEETPAAPDSAPGEGAGPRKPERPGGATAEGGERA